MARQIREVEGNAAEETTSHIFNTVNTNNINKKKMLLKATFRCTLPLSFDASQTLLEMKLRGLDNISKDD